MKKIAGMLLAVGLFVAVAAAPAFATHKPGHHEPPACQNAKGHGKDAVQQHNKHCYPPESSSATTVNGKKSSFSTTGHSAPAGITVGMLTIAGLGTFAVVLATRRLHRRVSLRA